MADRLRLLVDLNVVLDVVQNRHPHYEVSANVLDAVYRQEAQGLLAAHSITTFFYVVTRHQNRQVALAALTGLLDSFEVATVDGAAIRDALRWEWKDFEDAVQMAAAVQADADYLVTRNPADFEAELVRVIRPGELLPILASRPNDN